MTINQLLNKVSWKDMRVKACGYITIRVRREMERRIREAQL